MVDGVPASATASVPGCGGSGEDHALGELSLTDTSLGRSAGQPGKCTGLNVLTYADKEIVFTFGDFYGTDGCALNVVTGSPWTQREPHSRRRPATSQGPMGRMANP